MVCKKGDTKSTRSNSFVGQTEGQSQVLHTKRIDDIKILQYRVRELIRQLNNRDKLISELKIRDVGLSKMIKEQEEIINNPSLHTTGE